MNWKPGDVLYRRRPRKTTGDALVRLGTITKLKTNRHGVATIAVVSGRAVEYDHDQVTAVGDPGSLPAKLRDVLRQNPGLLPCRAPASAKVREVALWDRARGGWVCVTEIDTTRANSCSAWTTTSGSSIPSAWTARPSTGSRPVTAGSWCSGRGCPTPTATSSGAGTEGDDLCIRRPAVSGSP